MLIIIQSDFLQLSAECYFRTFVISQPLQDRLFEVILCTTISNKLHTERISVTQEASMDKSIINTLTNEQIDEFIVYLTSLLEKQLQAQDSQD